MASLEEADRTVKEARAGVYIRPYEGEDAHFALQMGPGGVCIQQKWWNNEARAWFDFTDADAAVGRTPEPTITISAVRIIIDKANPGGPKELKKGVVSLNKDQFATARKIGEEKKKNGVHGWERISFVMSVTKVKDKNRYDIRFDDYLEDLADEVKKIKPYSEDEIKQLVTKSDKDDTGGSKKTNAGSAVADEYISAEEAAMLSNKIREMKDPKAVADEMKETFGKNKDIKLRELKKSALAGALAFLEKKAAASAAPVVDID